MQQTQVTSKRITLVDKEQYKVDLEYNESFAIIHLPDIKLTKAAYQDMFLCLDNIEEFLEFLGYPHLWVAAEPENKVINRLATRFGFEYRGNADGYNVYMKEIEECLK